MATLSRREREVADLLVQGLTHGEIAGQLNISVHTVRLYVRLARAKTGCKNSAELAVRCALTMVQHA